MSVENGYATRESLFASPFERRFADHEQLFNGQPCKFQLQNLNDAEKGDFDSDAVNSKGKFKRQSIATANARVIVLGCAKPKFSNADVAILQGYDSGEIEELAEAIRKHCGWEDEPEKNSDTIDDDDSHSS